MKLLILLFITQTSHIFAFSSSTSLRSLNGHNIHAKITHRALKKMGFSFIARQVISSGNVSPDIYKVDINNPDLHCDRNRHVSSFLAVSHCRASFLKMLSKSIESINKGDHLEGLLIYGKVLHTLQDFVAHSNYIDLSKAEQAQVQSFLFDQKKVILPKIKITGWDHRHAANERSDQLKGDRYNHRHFSKDSNNANKEARMKFSKYRSKHEEAFYQAVLLSRKMTLKLKKSLSLGMWKKIQMNYPLR